MERQVWAAEALLVNRAAESDKPRAIPKARRRHTGRDDAVEPRRGDLPIDLRYVWRRELRILGSTGYTREDIAKAVRLVELGRLKPVIGRVFSLPETALAQSLLEQRAFFGKFVVVPSSS